MLFDTPTLSITAAAATPTKFTGAAASKKRARSSDAVSTSKASVEMNLDKLMKRMRKTEKDSGWGGSLGAGGKSGVEAEEAAARKKSKKSKTGGGGGGGGREDRPAKAEVQKEVKGEVKPNRFQPAKKDKRVSNLAKREKKAAAATWSPASSANATYVPSFASTVPESTSAVVDAPRFTAPNHHDAESDEATTSGPQTELQKSLRAKLAGGRFRMLNETLYTTTGAEARNVMTDPGAFDDYHAGFRSQSAHWPSSPLTLLTESLSQLPPRSLIADFGSGDSQLARSLVPLGLKVISFDLLSKDGWTIEAECSSGVPLPGGGPSVSLKGKKGTKGRKEEKDIEVEEGGVVDAVVCCLSLMGTDWVGMIREARRVLVNGGQLKIAEVASRFVDLDQFVKCIEEVGFESVSKDTTNTHFVMLDFVRTTSGEFLPREKNAITAKAKDLLRPCVYKKR